MAEELSLVIKNPEEGKFLKQISWNKQEFMNLVQEFAKQYEGAVYSEDQIDIARKDRAKLNAMKTAISNRRIEIKKEIMIPYTQFEEEVKEVVALIEEPIALIDRQINEYDKRVKEEKKKELKDYFEEVAGDLDGILTFDRVFDQKYLNRSTSVKSAKASILEKAEHVRTDLRSLEVFCEDKYLVTAKDVYIRTLNVSQALSEVKRLKEFERKAEEERLRRQEEAEAKAEIPEEKPSECIENEQKEIIKTPDGEAAGHSEEPIDTPDTSADAPKIKEKQYKASFTVHGTKAQIMALKQYMIEHNIKFGKVEK